MKVLYKKKVIAYVDVLGFSDIVLNTNVDLIETYFSYLKDSLKIIAKGKRQELYYISDSIILSTNDTILNFEKLIDTLRYVQAQLLAKNILTRGAISIGDHYVNKKENIIVGPALVKAYNLESLAKYPRIILDRQLIEYFNFKSAKQFIKSLNYKFSKDENRQYISIDNDNQIFVNYLSYTCSRRQHYTTKKTIEDLHKLLQKYSFQNLHLDKYNWLKDKTLIELDRQLKISEKTIPVSHSAKIQQHKFQKEIPKWITLFEEL